MLLDREYQNALLNFLLEDFPLYEKSNDHCQKLIEENQEKYLANVEYLQKHCLLEDGVSLSFSADGFPCVSFHPYPQITAKGIDFILNDGGLSAILNVQTIKIHEDSIKALIIEQIAAASLPEHDKATLLDTVKSLPATALKKLLDKLLDKGLETLLEGGVAGLISLIR